MSAWVKDEKGNESLSATGVGDSRLALFFKTARGLSRKQLRTLLESIFREAARRGDSQQELQMIVDAFVMAVYTRDIREGKGERDLFYWLLMDLNVRFPQTVEAMLPLLPSKYGFWKDLENLWYLAKEDAKAAPERRKALERFQKVIQRLIVAQLEKDRDLSEKIMEAQGDDVKVQNLTRQLSLAAKWVPREGGELAKKLGQSLFGKDPAFRPDGSVMTRSLSVVDRDLAEARKQGHRQSAHDLRNERGRALRSCMKRYRKLVSNLNRLIKTVEVKMCAGEWAQVEPGAVPAKALNLYRKAFANEIGKGPQKGEQRSEDEVRVQCAANFAAHMAAVMKGEAKVNARNMMPHELVDAYFRGAALDATHEAQWKCLRDTFGVGGRVVAVSDVSGSMAGIPMMVAIAMGILTSEVAHPAFRDGFITFSSSPQWHDLSCHRSLHEKVQSARGANWGYTTNMEATLDMILGRCLAGAGGVPVTAQDLSEMTLAIFSDMQFDYADRSYTSKHDKIKKRFADAGYRDPTTGEGILPRILFWNLRGDTVDFPAAADTPGVTMVSGFSANVLRAFMEGEDMRSAVETPYDEMRKILDDERYDDIRALVAEVGEVVSSRTGERYVPLVRVEENGGVGGGAAGGGGGGAGGEEKQLN